MNVQDAIILAVQEKGSDATDVRDAAHEMCHAFESEADNWSRNGIHDALKTMYGRQPGDLLRAEVLARAVERKVCEHFEVEYDIEHWLMMAAMETMREFSNVPANFWKDAVGNCMRSRECAEMVERILIVGEDRIHNAL